MSRRRPLSVVARDARHAPGWTSSRSTWRDSSWRRAPASCSSEDRHADSVAGSLWHAGASAWIEGGGHDRRFRHAHLRRPCRGVRARRVDDGRRPDTGSALERLARVLEPGRRRQRRAPASSRGRRRWRHRIQCVPDGSRDARVCVAPSQGGAELRTLVGEQQVLSQTIIADGADHRWPTAAAPARSARSGRPTAGGCSRAPRWPAKVSRRAPSPDWRSSHPTGLGGRAGGDDRRHRQRPGPPLPPWGRARAGRRAGGRRAAAGRTRERGVGARVAARDRSRAHGNLGAVPAVVARARRSRQAPVSTTASSI